MGKVSKVLPGIQTAFVDIGQNKAGFLHISEVDRALATEKIVESLQAARPSRPSVKLTALDTAVIIKMTTGI